MKPGLTWDMTLSWNPAFRNTQTLERFRTAGFNVIGLTIASDRPGSAQLALDGLRSVRRLVEQEPERYALVQTASDLEDLRSSGRLGLELNFQGTSALEGSIQRVQDFYDLGVRHMGLVWNEPNAAGSSATLGHDDGLTAYGARLVRQMNRVGVIVDGTHASRRTSLQAMEICEKPFIFSHSNVNALQQSYKNLDDDQIKECAGTGGVIGVSGLGSYLDDPQADADSMRRQIDYIAQLVGHEHVGLGLDFVADAATFWKMVDVTPQLWPAPGGGPMPRSEFFAPERIAGLENALVRAGYSDTQVAGIFGENWLRVCRACWPAMSSSEKPPDIPNEA